MLLMLLFFTQSITRTVEALMIHSIAFNLKLTTVAVLLFVATQTSSYGAESIQLKLANGETVVGEMAGETDTQIWVSSKGEATQLLRPVLKSKIAERTLITPRDTTCISLEAMLRANNASTASELALKSLFEKFFLPQPTTQSL